MRWIIESSLRFRLLVVVVAAGVMAFGIVQLRDAPVDVLPEFTPPYVEIQTEALGLSADEVEQLITVPLEADLLNGVAASTRSARSRFPACRRSSWSSSRARTSSTAARSSRSA